jgi:uncharacterized membrane protein
MQGEDTRPPSRRGGATASRATACRDTVASVMNEGGFRSRSTRVMRSFLPRWCVYLGLALAAWLVVLGASAQSTGSSAGGSSWGSESSSSSSSSSGSSGGWSSSSSDSYGSVASANSYEPPFWGQLLIAIGFFVFCYLLIKGFGRLTRPPNIGVAIVQVAIDARARRFVQDALSKMVATSDTQSKRGLAALLGAAARALTASKLAWIYGRSERWDPAPTQQARATHTLLANDARARFKTELVRKADGQTLAADAPALVAREHEGEGVVVVTLVVASHAKFASGPTVIGGIDQLLASFAALSAADLVALEVIWSPAAENDRMSTDELEALYPELTRLTAVGGRVFCSYCGGPHAAELAKCPHCGAPTDPSKPASA